MTKSNRRKKGGSSKKAGSVDSLIINSHKATGSTTTVVRSDISFKRQNFNMVSKPPRSLSNQTYWVQLSADTTLSASNLTVTETNFTFTASGFNGFSSLLSAFDQYCIYSVVATFSCMSNVTTPVRLYTALDYDSTALIGKAALQTFSTFEFTSLSGDGSTSLVRYVKPCLATQLTNSSILPVPAGVSRAWIDSGYPTILHYGLRTIIDTWVNISSNVVELSFTGILGFRNNV